MHSIRTPSQLLLLCLVGWGNREQQRAIEYLRTENRVLREKLGKQRVLLNDDQRRRLAVQGNLLGRKLLAEVCTLFTPDTILRWHRWVQSIQQECLDHFLVFGPQHFDHLISEYVDYYHTERPHQSLENRPLVGHWPEPDDAPEKPPDGDIVCRSRLGGWLKSYARKAA